MKPNLFLILPHSLNAGSIYLTSIFCFIILMNFPAPAQTENLSVIQHWMRYQDAPNALYQHLADQALVHLAKRTHEISQIKTRADWQKRQEKIRETLLRLVGPFPQKTPLNAKTRATLQRDGFRIEKVVYESRPQFYVTAILVLPDGLTEPRPAIIYCSGHTPDGFRAKAYQHVIFNLARKGFVVLAFDPVGQGERLEYFDPETGESRIGGPTLEHSYPGAQCFLVGSSQARHMLWDGIRSVDYLLTRKEVDPQRIGITGRSGGGTQSAYIAAFDDRILATAPECYLTSFEKLLESIGLQDAEQNFFHGIANGIDHADLLEVRAPKPALLIATTRDFFNIQGARKTSAEVRRIYEAFGAPENYTLAEDDAPHESTKNNREAMYAFFQKHLNWPGDTTDEEVTYLTDDALNVTPTGQISTTFGGETIFSLNTKEAAPFLKNLEDSRKNTEAHLENVLHQAKALAGFQPPDAFEALTFTARYQRSGYTLELYFIKGEGQYPLPFILMKPDSGGPHPALIYLHAGGKSTEAAPGKEMEWFVKQGYWVLAPDLLGIGELGDGDFHGDASNFKLGRAAFNIWFAAIQNARSITGIQAGDILRLVNFLRSCPGVQPEQIHALARGEMCGALVHAAAFDQSISKIALIEPLVAYRWLVTHRYYRPGLIPTTVAGALPVYDLPDLTACLAPRKLLVVNGLNQMGNRAQLSQIKKEMEVTREAYKMRQAEKKFQLKEMDFTVSRENIFEEWLLDGGF
jgi:cephalosporin-C deacetylase-like acetyl esterase